MDADMTAPTAVAAIATVIVELRSGRA